MPHLDSHLSQKKNTKSTKLHEEMLIECTIWVDFLLQKKSRIASFVELRALCFFVLFFLFLCRESANDVT